MLRPEPARTYWKNPTHATEPFAELRANLEAHGLEQLLDDVLAEPMLGHEKFRNVGQRAGSAGSRPSSGLRVLRIGGVMASVWEPDGARAARRRRRVHRPVRRVLAGRARRGRAVDPAHARVRGRGRVAPVRGCLSAEPQSGKTRYLEVLKLLVRAPLFAVNISEAALFRVIEARRPTILHDEIDAVFGPKARDREDLRAMLNAGYERGATVERCVGEGSKLEVKSFPVFAPVAMAGIGKLPETVEQRSIVVRMKRRAPDETGREAAPPPGRTRSRAAPCPARGVGGRERRRARRRRTRHARRARRPCAGHLGTARRDRGRCRRRLARGPASCVKALFGARRDDEATIGVRLLADIRGVFGDGRRARVGRPRREARRRSRAHRGPNGPRRGLPRTRSRSCSAATTFGRASTGSGLMSSAGICARTSRTPGAGTSPALLQKCYERSERYRRALARERR